MSEQIKNLYEAFNEGNIQYILDQFAPNAVVINETRGTSYKGTDGIAQGLAFWPEHFEGAHVEDYDIQVMPENERDLHDADEGYVVTLRGKGKHVKDIEHHEGQVLWPATNTDVEVIVTERLFMLNGKIMLNKINFEVKA